MTQLSDEDKLIQALQTHKALKQWAVSQLKSEGVQCEETYGNSSAGDIKIVDPSDSSKVQGVCVNLNAAFNASALPQDYQPSRSSNPHLEIKSAYIYGHDIDEIIDKTTVVAVVSSSNISKPGKRKLNASGVVYVENVPKSEFVEDQ